MKLIYIVYGLGLSLVTAIASILYERLVRQYGFGAIAAEKVVEAIAFYLILSIVFSQTKINWDFLSDKNWWFYLGAVAIPILWFLLTWKYNVLVGTFYEVSYLIPLLVLYILLGTQKLTITFILGACMVIVGLIIISL
jgi:hypothetical protein